MRLVALVFAGLILVACGEEQPSAPSDEPGDPTILEGTLGGDPELEGGCAWLDTDDGRYEVLYPQGYELGLDPVRLTAPDGDTVAEEGDTVRVRGQVTDDVVSVCQVGTIFRATEVES